MKPSFISRCAVTRSVSRRSLALVILGTETAAVGARLLDRSDGLVWAIRVVLPTLGVALLPGAAVVLASLPRRTWALTELVVVAFGTSAVIVQLATITALTGHFSAATILSVLLAGTLALTIVVAARHSPVDAVTLTGTEMAWWMAVTVLGAFLYLQGSPYLSGEDYLHLGVIRRLAWAP